MLLLPIHFSITPCDTMPSQKQILQDRLHDSISKTTMKRSKKPPAAPKAKSVLGKENRAAKVAKKAATVQLVSLFYLNFMFLR